MRRAGPPNQRKTDMTDLSNDYWMRREAWEQAVADMFREDFPELARHKIKVCGNGTVYVFWRPGITPGTFKGYPAWVDKG